MVAWVSLQSCRRTRWALAIGLGSMLMAAGLLGGSALWRNTDSVRAQVQATDITGQAAELSAFTEEAIERLRPMWTEEDKDYVAETVRIAVLGAYSDPLPQQPVVATKGALPEESVAAIERVIERFLGENYGHPARETHECQREVLRWIIADVARSPAPDPADVERLRSQFRDLLSWFGQVMRADLGLPDEEVSAALAQAEKKWVDDVIDDPFYRFDRVPLSADALMQGRTLMQEELQAAKAGLDAIDAASVPDKFRAQFRAWRRKASTRDVGTRALRAVVRQQCGWRVSPVATSDQARSAGQAQQVATEAWQSYVALEPVARVLEGLLVGREAVGMAPDLGAPLWLFVCPEDGPRAERELSPTERHMLGELRGPVRTAALVTYDVKIALPARVGGEEQALMVVDAHCRLQENRAEVAITGVSAYTRPFSPDLLQRGTTYRIGPAAAEVLRPGGDLIAKVDRQSGEVTLRGPASELPSLALLLSAAADMWDAAQAAWRTVKEPEDGAPAVEVDMGGPAGKKPGAQIARLRYSLGSMGGPVAHAAALDTTGEPLAQVAFDEATTVGNEGSVFMRARTEIKGGAQPQRVAVPDRGVIDTEVPRSGQKALTVYEWSGTGRVRLPARRHVEDLSGRTLASFEFSGHRVLPAE